MKPAHFSFRKIKLISTVLLWLLFGVCLGVATLHARPTLASQNLDRLHAADEISFASQKLETSALSTQAYSWNISRVEAEKTFSEMETSSLALDVSGNPHIAYGQDHLYHAWYAGGSWQMEVVDSSWGVGRYASLALDSFGYAHISYYDAIHEDLKYTYFDGSDWQIETLDQLGKVGTHTAIVLDTTDHPYISYYDETHQDLKYAHYDGSAWQIETVDSLGDTGISNSLVLDAEGRPHLCYVVDGVSLKCAAHDGTAWNIETVVPAESGEYISNISLAMDSVGWPHLSYFDGMRLKYAYLDGEGWHFEGVEEESEDFRDFLYISLKLDALDHPHLSYQYVHHAQRWGPGYYTFLKYAYYDGVSWQIEAVDETGLPGAFGSLTLDALGGPHISYFDAATHTLKYAQLDGETWQTEVLDYSIEVGFYSTLVLDASGYPHISYYESASRSLKYAHFDGSGWHFETVEEGLYATQSISLALDSLSQPHISYHDKVAEYKYGSIKYAHFDGSTWQIEIIGSEPANQTSIAIDSADWPHIAYVRPASVVGYTQSVLFYTYFDGNNWLTTEVDSQNVDSVSLVLDSLDRPHLSYRKLSLRYAYFDGLTWHIEQLAANGGHPSLALDSLDRPHITSINVTVHGVEYAYFNGNTWEIEVIDSGWSPSLALDNLDHPHLSYYGLDPTEEGALKYATFDGIGWQIETIDPAGEVGFSSSIAIDASNYAHISYYDATNGDLKYAVDGPPPALTFNHSVGAPGSYLNVLGQGFPPDQVASIYINQIEVGTQLLDATGALTFTLDTQNSEAGFYMVWVHVNPLNINPSAFASFALEPNAPQWPKEGEYPVYIAPATSLKLTFLPLIRK